MNKSILLSLFFLCVGAFVDAQTCLPKIDFTFTDTCDRTDNDTCFWSRNGWWDSVHGRSNLAETAVELKVEAPNLCNGTGLSLSFEYELFLDLDNNGLPETVVSSRHLPPPNKVFWGNAANPGFSGGAARPFDHRTGLGMEHQYAFVLQTDSLEGRTTAAVRWNALAKPDVFEQPLLPLGKHHIKWRLYASGNLLDSVQYEVQVKDCHKPYVACKALSVNLMQTKTVRLWASDFFEFAFDNATLSEQLVMGITRNAGQGKFPLDSVSQQPISSVSFFCADIGSVPIEVWMRDKAGNEGFCATSLKVMDALRACTNDPDLQICAGSENGLQMTEFYIDITHFNIPIALPNAFWQTAPVGCMTLNHALPLAPAYIITPRKSDNPLTGVTTLDLALLTKHVLGIQPITNPYKFIAADATGSGTVTMFDVVELRKLILGIYDELPAIPSWRFVRRNFVFPNPSNPFATSFPEKVSVGELLADSSNGQFIAIKIGDLNGPFPFNKASTITDRSALSLWGQDATMQSGQTLDLPLHFSESSEYLGFQFCLQYDPTLLDIEIVDAAQLPGFDRESWAKPLPGVLNVSWFRGQACQLLSEVPVLTLRLRARAHLRLSEVLKLSTQRFEAEVYTDAEDVRPINFLFRSSTEGANEAANVLAPKPNPTATGASIGLWVSQPGPVRLSLSDLSGKLVYFKHIYLAEGTQTLDIPEAAMSAAGVYFWRLETGQQQQGGKLMKY